MKWLGNKAKITDNIEENTCSLCDTEYIFRMKDNHHEFNIALQDVLSMLAMAEAEGVIPKLPEMWWEKIRERYR